MLEVDWKLHAACRGMDPQLFVPPSPLPGQTVGERLALRRAINNQAIPVCKTCPVQRACGEYRVATRSYVGVWGGKYYVPRSEKRNRPPKHENLRLRTG